MQYSNPIVSCSTVALLHFWELLRDGLIRVPHWEKGGEAPTKIHIVWCTSILADHPLSVGDIVPESTSIIFQERVPDRLDFHGLAEIMIGTRHHYCFHH